jgi:hypothetical protein
MDCRTAVPTKNGTGGHKMNEKKEKKERKLTPIGEAKWAHIHTPKAPFEDRGKPSYQIDVVFPADNPEWDAWAKHVMENFRKLPEQIDKQTGITIQKKPPVKRELDENDNPTGRFFVKFKTGTQFKPGVFDRFGNPIPVNVLIGNGSMVRVSYTENMYDGFGGGINFYLNAVQVVDLVEYKAQTASAFGFPVEENETPQATEEPEEGGIPF